MAETPEETPTVPIVCEECDTETRIPVADLPAAIDRHNRQLHDGDDVAGVDPEIAAELQDLVAEDMGLYEG